MPPWAPYRPDPAVMTGNLDTTDTAGPTARQGHIEQVSGVFPLAGSLDRARVPQEGQAGEEPGLPARGVRYQQGWRPSPEAAEELRKQGFAIDPQTGQVIRAAPPSMPPGAGMGTMLDVTEELK